MSPSLKIFTLFILPYLACELVHAIGPGTFLSLAVMLRTVVDVVAYLAFCWLLSRWLRWRGRS